MYKVILQAEDGDYIPTGPMPEEEALQWIKDNEDSYGEGQELCLEWVGD